MIKKSEARLYPDTFVVSTAFLTFVTLGLPSGLLGVAWSPSILKTFGLALGDVGVLSLVSTVGSLLVSFNSGRIISRLGMGVFLALGASLLGIGLLGYALAPSWIFMIGASFLLGAGAGSIDPGLNTYAATVRSPRFMNWLHACFGLGAAIGPLIMTMLLGMALSWRWGYGLVGIGGVLLAVTFGMTRHNWAGSSDSSGLQDGSMTQSSIGETLRLPVVWLSIALFFVYGGIEISAGLWAYSLFTVSRGVTPATAGFWVSVYWASLTIGRILFGALVDRMGASRLLRLCMVGVIAGAGLLWLDVSNIVSFFGLALIGFAQAPIFPLLMSTTPRRLGSSHAPNAIGFQVAAAALGIAALPALAGVIAENWGMEIVGPYLLILACVMFLLNESVVRGG